MVELKNQVLLPILAIKVELKNQVLLPILAIKVELKNQRRTNGN